MSSIPKVGTKAHVTINRSAVKAGKLISIAQLNRYSRSFDPKVLSVLKKVIESNNGEVLALVHPRYSELISCYRSGGSYAPEYEAYQEKLENFLKPSSRPILCFLQEHRARELENWLQGLKLKATLISIVIEDGPLMPPLLSSSQKLSALGLWFRLAEILEEIGVKNISYVGERVWESNGKVEGCVAHVANHLQMFGGRLIDEFVFRILPGRE